MERLRADLHALVRDNQPMTVRQVFYRAVSAGLIDKTEGEYKTTVCRLLADMRKAGEMPYRWIADNTRLMRKPSSYTGLHDLLSHTARVYRRDAWQQLSTYVEIWCEKDALSGVLYDATATWDVPLMICRGYASLTFLQASAETFPDNKPVVIYYLGDWDPSGLDIRRDVQAKLRRFAPHADITFEALAVTEHQIAEYSLLTRPTKQSDSRARHFQGESVEADAIPPQILRQLVEDAIAAHVDPHVIETLQIAEDSERDILHSLADRYRWSA